MRLTGRIGIMGVVILVLMALVVTTVMAAPPPWTPAARKAKFTDVTADHWAAPAICKALERKIVRGYEDGSFRPNSSVKRIEALVMIVNTVMAEEEIEDNNDTSLTCKYLHQAPWAAKHIAVALDKGIIEKAELAAFRPLQAAKRYEVAQWLARAIAAGADVATEILEAYKDYADVPFQARHALGLLVQKGILKGSPGNLLLPNKPVTRAEMVALLGNLDLIPHDQDGEEEEDITAFWGPVWAVEEGRGIIVITGAGRQRFAIDTNRIYLWEDGEATRRIDFRDIDADDLVYIRLDEDGKVIYVGVCVEEGDYKGTIVNLGLNTITIEDEDEMEWTFLLREGTRYKGEGIDGRRDLEPGMAVAITANGGVAGLVRVIEEKTTNAEGVITRFLKPLAYIWLDGNRYPLASAVEVKIDGDDTKDITDLEEDWYALLAVRNNKVTAIEAWSPLAGNILAFDEEKEELIVETGADKIVAFDVDDDLPVFVGDEEAVLEALLALLEEDEVAATIYHKGDNTAVRVYVVEEV